MSTKIILLLITSSIISIVDSASLKYQQHQDPPQQHHEDICIQILNPPTAEDEAEDLVQFNQVQCPFDRMSIVFVQHQNVLLNMTSHEMSTLEFGDHLKHYQPGTILIIQLNHQRDRRAAPLAAAAIAFPGLLGAVPTIGATSAAVATTATAMAAVGATAVAGFLGALPGMIIGRHNFQPQKYFFF